MTTSNVEWREKIFGGQKTGTTDQFRPDRAKVRQNTAGLTGVSPAIAKTGLARLGFVDAGKGLAILLVILAAIIASAGRYPHGFGWLEGLQNFLQPFAVPAFLVFAGMFLKSSRDLDWPAYARRKIAPLILAALLWLGAAYVLTLALAGPGASTGLRHFFVAAGNLLHLAVLLFVLPLFYLGWKALARWRTGTIFVAAALVEILHTGQGGAFVVELMRGMVYFAAGHCFAGHFRALARYTSANRTAAIAILAGWAAFNGLMTSAAMPMAFGEKVSSLPFASLGLGLAGAAAMVMAGEFLASSRVGGFFRQAGQKWIAFYAVTPLAVYGLSHAMTAAGLFITPSQGVAALVCAMLASGLTLIGLELREPSQSTGRQTIRNL